MNKVIVNKKKMETGFNNVSKVMSVIFSNFECN